MNQNYILVADADCELPLSWVDEYDIAILPMPVTIDGVEHAYDLGRNVKLDDFFDRMRAGSVPTTAQANPEDFKEMFEPFLKDGKDIVYLGVSSGLSGTINCARLAAQELLETYGDRKIECVDTLAISMPMGMLVREAAMMRQQGKAMQEIVDYVEANKLRACAIFTVDDLVYLKRGGRVSGAAAFFGKLLEVKPLLHISPEGKLVPCGKVKGRKNAIKQLASMCAQYAQDVENQTVVLLKADAEEDAKKLEAAVREVCSPKEIVPVELGPVIGAHAGPGTLGVVFFAKDRVVEEA